MAGDLNFKVNFDTQQAGNEVLALLQKFAAGSEAAGDKLNRALGGTTERKLVIRTVRDDQGIKQLKSELVTIRSEADKIKTAFNNATKVESGSLTSLRQQLNRYTQLRDELSQFDKAIDLTNRKDVISAKQTSQWIEADAKVKELTASIRNLQDADKGFGGRLVSTFGDFLAIGNKLQDVVTIFQSIGIAVGAITAPVKAATNALADLDAFKLSFAAIGESAGTAQAALGDTTRIALGLGVNIKTVREGFQQLSPVVLNAGGSMSDVSAITESLSSRFAAFGLSAEKSRRVLNGVIQAFAKGKLQAEEFTQQIAESDPAIKGDFAKALFAVRGELGALGKEVDGTVKNLEELVKQGKITSDVLIKVIPALSKSSILFGKLGPTATSAVEALKKGDVTINQVRSNFESLNQLNLERLANIAKPLVQAFLSIEASVIDFVTTISKLQVTKDIIGILGNLGQAFGNIVNVILKAVEVFAVILTPIASFINLLSKIPGVTEIVGLALIANLIKPAAQAVDKFKKLRETIAGLVSGGLPTAKASGGILDPKQSDVAKRSLDALRAELQKPVESGVKKELGNITAATEKTDAAIVKLTKKQQKRFKDLSAEFQSATGLYDAEIAKLRQLESSLANNLKQPELASKGSIRAIQEQILKLRQLKEEAIAVRSEAGVALVQKQRGLEKQGIPYDFRKGTDEASLAVKKLVDNYQQAKDKVSGIEGQLYDLENQLKALGKAEIDPEITIADNLEKQINTSKTRLEVLRRDIKRFYLDIQGISAAPASGAGMTIPTKPINELENLTKSYERTALQAYANAQAGSSQYVQSLEKERQTLSDRQQELKAILDRQRDLGDIKTPGLTKLRDEFEQVSASLDKTDRALFQARNGFVESAKATADYSSGLAALNNGQELTTRQLSSFKNAAKINAIALKEARDNLESLRNKQAALTDQQKVLNAALSKPQKADQFKILKDSLKQTSGALEDVNGKIQNAEAAVNKFSNKARDIGTVIKSVGQSGSALDNIKGKFTELGQSSNKLVSLFGKVGSGVLGIGTAIGNGLKVIGAGIKAFGAELAIFAVIAAATTAYNKASESTRKIQEQNKQKADELKATIDDLSKSYSNLTGEVSKEGIGLVVPKFNAVDTVLVTLGNTISSVADGFINLFNKAAGFNFDKITGQVTKANNAFEQAASAIAIISAGIVTGALVAGPWGAAIGGVAAAVLVLASSLGSTRAKIEDLRKQGEALRQGYAQEKELLMQLVTQINNYGNAYLKAKNAAAAAANQGVQDNANTEKSIELYAKATTAYASFVNGVSSLKAKQEAAYRASGAALEQAAKLKQEIAALEAGPKGNDFWTVTGESDLGKIIQDKKADLRVTEELANQNVQAYRQIKAELVILQAELDRLREKYGLLSEEQLKNADNVSNWANKIKEGEQALQLLDFDTQRDQFDELAESLGRSRAELERVEKAAEGRKLAGYIEELQNQLNNGDIPESISNISSLVSALEQRSVILDINAPELPQVIRDLVEAKNRAAGLDGTKATITIQVIEQGLASGKLKLTEEIASQLKAAYAEANKNVEIGTPEYEANLQKIDELTKKEQNNKKSTADLAKDLSNKQSQLDRQNEDKSHQNALNNIKKQAEEWSKYYDRRKTQVTDYYDAEIAKLQELGPAEQQLADQRKKELQKKAQGTGQEALEAKAALERADREEKIAKLQEEKQKKLAEIEAQKAIAAKYFKEQEEDLIAKRTAAEENIAAIRQSSLDAERSALAERERAAASVGGSGSPAPKQPGTPGYVPTLTPEMLRQMQADGAKAKTAFNQGANSVPDQSMSPDIQQAVLDGQQDGQAYGNAYDNAQNQYQPTVGDYSNPDQATQAGQIDGKTYGSAVDNVLQDTVVEGPKFEQPQDNNKILNDLSKALQTLDKTAGDVTGKAAENTSELDKKLSSAGEGAKETQDGIQKTKESFAAISNYVKEIVDGMTNGLSSALSAGSEKVAELGKQMDAAFNREFTATVTIRVNKQGLWTGGPTTKGTTYKVNELGQEGFMNKFGKVTPIQRPRFGNWRAPSDGFVIPADIFAGMNQSAPKAGVKHGNPVITGNSNTDKTGSRVLSMALAQANNANIANSRLREEIAVSHAAQTLEIGKLTRAVKQLVDKDWNVDVNIKNNNNKTIAYMNTLNRIM